VRVVLEAESPQDRFSCRLPASPENTREKFCSETSRRRRVFADFRSVLMTIAHLTKKETI
jgi:hypothetical protein